MYINKSGKKFKKAFVSFWITLGTILYSIYNFLAGFFWLEQLLQKGGA